MEKYSKLKLFLLDNDDVTFLSSPLIQFHVEKNFPQFSAKKLQVLERTLSILKYQHNLIKEEIGNARKEGRTPIIPDFNVVLNDVLRDKPDGMSDYEYMYYIKPLYEIGECIQQASHNKEMFLEERDATIEKDGKLEKGVIPYDEIYSEPNWHPYAKQNVRDLYNIMGDRLISLTAHNGIDDMHGREFYAKGEAIHEMVSEIPHIGLRFHATEHIPGQRRSRNLKSERIMSLYGLEDLFGVVSADDSLENCLDIYRHGGSPILIGENKYNPYGFATAKSIRADSIMRELEKLGFSDASEEIYQKPKIYTKSR